MTRSNAPHHKESTKKGQKGKNTMMTPEELEERRLRARECQRKSRAAAKSRSNLVIHDMENQQVKAIQNPIDADVESVDALSHQLTKGKQVATINPDIPDCVNFRRMCKRQRLTTMQSRVIGEHSNQNNLCNESQSDLTSLSSDCPIVNITCQNQINATIADTSNHDDNITLPIWQNSSLPPIVHSTRRQVLLLDVGKQEFECPFCNALMFIGERSSKSTLRSPKFGMCCREGLIVLPILPQAPQLLKDLIAGLYDCGTSKFLAIFRNYNSLLSFTSMGGKIDMRVLDGHGPYTFKISGANYHMIGSLLPTESNAPKFGQLYIHDPTHEVDNRINTVLGINKQKIRRDIVELLQKMLDHTNPYVKVYRKARDLLSTDSSVHAQGNDLRIRILYNRSTDGRQYNLPTSDEVAALMVGDGSETVESRDIIVCKQDGALHRISETHPAYMPLQYPLLFPFGEEGWRVDIPYRNGMSSGRQKRVSIREYYSFRLQNRRCEDSILLKGGKLLQQYIVDAYAAIEQERLNWVRLNQNTIRSELFQGLQDAVTLGETNAAAIGQRFVLPSSFHGGPRDMYQNFQDAIAICRWAGSPDFFITFTCNPKWKEIKNSIQNQSSENRPDIIARVFNLKLKELLRDIKVKKIFGKVIADIYVIEFQKRGLPHAHILITVSECDKPKTIERIDNIVHAEIPDKEQYPIAHEIVMRCMIHGPCGLINMNSPCIIDGKCTKHYPRSFSSETTIDRHGYVQYRRRNDGKSYTIREDKVVDNRWVVPYNKDLLVKYDAHINVEICAHPKLIKYLYKYIHKGHDRSTIVIEDNTNSVSGGTTTVYKQVDEIKQFLDCRYVSSVEACWRIFDNTLHSQHPSIERLSFHLPNQHNVTFRENDSLSDVVTRTADNTTQLIGWFRANEMYAEARSFTYTEFPEKWVWHSNTKEWTLRKTAQFSIGRLYFAQPTSGERFYLRMLLCIIRGARNYEDVRTVGGVLYPTFKEACVALGLLEDDSEWSQALTEASSWATGHQLRMFFCSLLLFCAPTNPRNLWENHWDSMSDDYLRQHRRQNNNQSFEFTEDQLQNLALLDIEKILNNNGKSLNDFPDMPLGIRDASEVFSNSLVNDEMIYDVPESLTLYETLLQQLNEEQLFVLNSIIDPTKRGVHFVYGSGGTGKTFLYKCMIAKYRSERKIVISVASSGIAALLLPGGRTAHSRFKIPLHLHESSTCSISQQSHLSGLIQMTELIIWDEAPMTNRNAFEAVDRTLRDLLKFKNQAATEKLFGGINVVLGGDFRQILPVIPKAGREAIVASSVHRSYIWGQCYVYQLKQNMRLNNRIDTMQRHDHIDFVEWILKVGDGKLRDVENEDITRDVIRIPADLLIKGLPALIDNIYPSIRDSSHDYKYFEHRAILAPKNEEVDKINAHILSLFPGEIIRYLSADSIENLSTDDGQIVAHPTEFLNSIKSGGLAHHCLELKEGVPILLLRNLNNTLGLCNGTRLIVHKLGSRVIQAKIVTGRHVGELTLIPRIMMSPSLEEMPIAIRRRQFPVKLAFAMTINKSQGQTLHNVGLYLKNPVFCHGQLYVAISRCTSRSGLKILLSDDLDVDVDVTNNVVYKDVISDVENSVVN